jgi:nicotinate-nucleotide adenylyltransferase
MAEKKNIGLFFGSFNPVHIGHTQLAEYLIDKQLVDEVWFVISPFNPLKNKTELIDEYQRLRMMQLAIVAKPKIKVTDVEFNLPIPSYTINTLKVLRAEFPHFIFTLIMGSDNAMALHQWKNYKEILENHSIIVYPRDGYDASNAIKQYPQIKLLPTPFYNINSTEIRKYISENKDVRKWLAPQVFEYIKDNNLYL